MAYKDKADHIKYIAEHYDRIEIKRKKGQKAKLQEVCKELGTNVSDFINTLIDEKLKELGKEL